MKRYIYKARDDTGKIISGEVEASSENLAAKLVRKRKLVVISITPVREGFFGFFRKFQNRITLGQVSTFTRQLSTMVSAGLPLTQSLLILRNQQPSFITTQMFKPYLGSLADLLFAIDLWYITVVVLYKTT